MRALRFHNSVCVHSLGSFFAQSSHTSAAVAMQQAMQSMTASVAALQLGPSCQLAVHCSKRELLAEKAEAQVCQAAVALTR